MSYVINIQSIKINTMASNASLNIGPAFHSKQNAVTHAQGSNISNGDRSPTKAYMQNTLWNTGNQNDDNNDDKQEPEHLWKIGGQDVLPPHPHAGENEQMK
ncbi:spore germination protein [Ectobacillus panaciterrae]|uniref:spore germination protein n=1 Tax=Ectobacillus panaciterrae TaxID=363872 RepID=UPI0004023757|nr:spore germination protein [Ectobacillus panaciterrae]